MNKNIKKLFVLAALVCSTSVFANYGNCSSCRSGYYRGGDGYYRVGGNNRGYDNSYRQDDYRNRNYNRNDNRYDNRYYDRQGYYYGPVDENYDDNNSNRNNRSNDFSNENRRNDNDNNQNNENDQNKMNNKNIKSKEAYYHSKKYQYNNIANASSDQKNNSRTGQWQ